MEPENRSDTIQSSWNANAAAWTRAVRGGLICSRRVGTDAAILDACLQLQPRRVLDVGCGEGWLARELTDRGIEVVGIDAASALVDAARAAGSPARYDVIPYERLIEDANCHPGPWELIVCNFSLFGDPLSPLLVALQERLSPNGRLVIQTVHPWTASGDGPYVSGWREETFANFPIELPAAMPWYSRTLESWFVETRKSGLQMVGIAEPTDPATSKPLSLLFTMTRIANSPT